MSRPFKLFRLQQIDTFLDGLHLRLKQVEEELLDDREMREIGQKRTALENEYTKTKKKLRDAEFETQQQRIKIEQTESSLYGGKVRNPKELQDLQNETAALKRYLSVLEEKQFNLMLEEEEVASQFEAVNDELEKASHRYEERIRTLQQEKSKLEKDVERSEGERQAALLSIEAEDLELYTKLRPKKRGIAVAKVNERACSACGSVLNTTLLNTAYSPNQISLCDSCGRILYTG